MPEYEVMVGSITHEMTGTADSMAHNVVDRVADSIAYEVVDGAEHMMTGDLSQSTKQ